jgi:hypothetical protein
LLLGSCISLFFISEESDGGPILTVAMLRSIIWRRYYRYFCIDNYIGYRNNIITVTDISLTVIEWRWNHA